MNGLTLIADGELFAVDVTAVERVVRNMTYTPVPAAPDAVAGIAGLKGGIVTILSLSELLGRGRGEQSNHAVVFKPFASGDSQMGLLIDSPGDLITINDSEIFPPHMAAEAEEGSIISGLAETGGKLYRIIDVYSIPDKLGDSGKKPSGVSQGGSENYEEG